VQEEVQTVIPNTRFKEPPSSNGSVAMFKIASFLSNKNYLFILQAWVSKETNAYWHCWLT
jgi:hypothetical protein